MKINLRIFGQLKDIVGSDRIELDDVNDTDVLIAALKEKYPKIGNSSFAISVDRKIVKGKVALGHESEVALLPPFSGG
jgi:molybdopterin converting factor small subunit